MRTRPRNSLEPPPIFSSPENPGERLQAEECSTEMCQMLRWSSDSPRIHPKLRRLTREYRCLGCIQCELLKIKVMRRLTRQRSNTIFLLGDHPILARASFL